MYYIGLDVHKKTISFCVKDAAGCVHGEGKIGSTRHDLDCWVRTLPQPRMIAMETTIFTGWIYDHLLPHAEKVKVAHSPMLRAIAAAKKKNDKIDASKIADCLRCDFLPECHMASTQIRDRRRVLRYRNLVVKQMVQMKDRVSGLLIETGVTYNKQQLHKVGYFGELLGLRSVLENGAASRHQSGALRFPVQARSRCVPTYPIRCSMHLTVQLLFAAEFEVKRAANSALLVQRGLSDRVVETRDRHSSRWPRGFMPCAGFLALQARVHVAEEFEKRLRV